jgi:hypothetical protein
VGLAGLEPAPSSLSAITPLPLCEPAFSQVAGDRRGSSNALLRSRPTRARIGHAAADKLEDQFVAGKAMGLPVGAAAPSSGGTVTVVRPHARLGLCGPPVWRRARPARPPAPDRQRTHRGKRRASWVGGWVRAALGRSAGRVSRWGWRSALGPAAAGGRRPRRAARARRPGGGAKTPRLDVRWAVAGPVRRWLRPGRWRSCRPGSWPPPWPPAPGPVRVWTWLPPELVNQRRWALADDDGIQWLVPATLTVAS